MSKTNEASQERDIDTVFPYAKNVKDHDKKQVEKIALSIKTFGWQGNPIVVNEEGVILAGHGRRLAAISLGMKKVPVKVATGLSDEAQRAYRLADNRVAMSTIDSELLRSELDDLDFDMAGLFEQKELDFLVADLSEMKIESFVSDLDEEVANQSAETSKKIKDADAKDVRIDKVLGFSTIKGGDERHIARFMAKIEEASNKTGAEAFVAYAKATLAA